MTDIESLANELYAHWGEPTTLDEPAVGERWKTLAAHVLRLCAEAELRGLVAARDRSFGMSHDAIRRLIAAHHAKHTPKCEHPPHRTQPIFSDPNEPNRADEVKCMDCGATRTRGWTSDWIPKEPGK